MCLLGWAFSIDFLPAPAYDRHEWQSEMPRARYSELVTPPEFATKWAGSTRTERAASQEHFIDLCRMLGYPTPNQADPTGDTYAFEKGAEKTEGGDGFADVWKKGFFGWEYKGKRKDLKAAYSQLLEYREALENPPLLVVCDLDRFEVHTNFTGTVKQVLAFDLNDLATNPTEPLRILRAVMGDPERLRPDVRPEDLTEDAARAFARLALSLRDRGHDSQSVAHFLDKLLFCLFAEDAGLLPRGLLTRVVTSFRRKPDAFNTQLAEVFRHMSTKGGGNFGSEHVEWFNGSLFDGADVIPLETAELDVLATVAKLDWAEIEPAIFGTLFERGLDPDRRTQLGAHYTDRDSILRLVQPVLIAPLRRDFEALKAQVAELAMGYPVHRLPPRRRKTVDTKLREFLTRLRTITVLDPACGSGNFLYIALQALKDLEREVLLWASATLRVPMQYPQVGPHQLHGIEINPYAAELTRVTIWIGEIQWMLHNGFAYLRDPVLRPLHNIETRDALIDSSDPENLREADWPDAYAIVGNPPFLGANLMIRKLGETYVKTLRRIFAGRVPGGADFVTYWHEKARTQIESGKAQRAGLLATQAIRGGANRRVVERIKASGDLFLAWSDQPWVLSGAAVHVSFLGYDDGSDHERRLDGEAVTDIHANLTAGIDLTKAAPLRENFGIAFQGPVKVGPFDVDAATAASLIAAPNPDGRSNADVVRPFLNAADITGRSRNSWIIDFGHKRTAQQAALYEAPFEYVRTHVKPFREGGRRAKRVTNWWIHGEPAPGLHDALRVLDRYIATPQTAKYRLFVWRPSAVLPSVSVIAITREDDYAFGVLHSRVHELWGLRMGTQLETRPRYTPTTTFETFPFPRPTEGQRQAIALAAKRLDDLREGWLNPAGASDEELGFRTLTNLYNERPTWLADAHEVLDRAVLAAYGWSPEMDSSDILEALLQLNLERAAASKRG